MRIFAFAIGAALAGTPAQPEQSLQSERPASSAPAQPAQDASPKAPAPGPEVMKPLVAEPDLCLSARCATV